MDCQDGTVHFATERERKSLGYSSGRAIPHAKQSHVCFLPVSRYFLLDTQKSRHIHSEQEKVPGILPCQGKQRRNAGGGPLFEITGHVGAK